jgi:hypothetical protein
MCGLVYLSSSWSRHCRACLESKASSVNAEYPFYPSLYLLSIVLIGAMLAGNLWLETISQASDQIAKNIWSTLPHNRWNVFVGAEEYVTWEIAPGLLED